MAKSPSFKLTTTSAEILDADLIFHADLISDADLFMSDKEPKSTAKSGKWDETLFILSKKMFSVQDFPQAGNRVMRKMANGGASNSNKDKVAEKDEDGYSAEPDEGIDIKEADIVCSDIDGWSDWHMPVLDLDISHTYIPSTHIGHGHLYLNKPLEWEKYVKLLDVLVECGIIEEGFANASKIRGYTAVRLPWVQKKIHKKKI